MRRFTRNICVTWRDRWTPFIRNAAETGEKRRRRWTVPRCGSTVRSVSYTHLAAVELGSEHPLAQAVVEKAKAEGLSIPSAETFEAQAGRGVRARVGGREYLAGNAAFMKENGLDAGGLIAGELDRLAKEGKTPLLFSRDGAVRGIIAVADTVRDSSREAIRRFHRMGLRVVMLTGDNRLTAEAIRRQLDIEEAIADVLPTEKEACVRALQAVSYTHLFRKSPAAPSAQTRTKDAAPYHPAPFGTSRGIPKP